MSGTVCGILDQRIYTAGDDTAANQIQFTNIYNFFQRMVAVGNAERVAYNMD